ncbi:hypothetical protein [Actinomadura logoneensis]|uniref:hypothetical protein n=1 Tax=Actinomadura logoneensis TaxID=2293572 RepID=UPI0011C16D19|nr:hypothetical protein [Actinomadura logoneensis]
MSRRLTVIAGVLAASAALPTAHAFATTEVWVSRSGHTLAHGWAPAGGDRGRTAVMDHRKGNWVKNEYNRFTTGNHKYTLWNKLGPGRSTYTKSGSHVTKIHICEDRDWAPDTCSKWTPVR